MLSTRAACLWSMEIYNFLGMLAKEIDLSIKLGVRILLVAVLLWFLCQVYRGVTDFKNRDQSNSCIKFNSAVDRRAGRDVIVLFTLKRLECEVDSCYKNGSRSRLVGYTMGLLVH